jgi:endonuclease I
MKSKKWTGIILFFLIWAANNSYAQFNFQSVFPDLNGNALFIKLNENFKPDTVLDYSMARDTLYAVIDNQNDTVYCIYSGYGLYLPENVDPTEYLYFGGSQNGINAEHTYPVSKGTEAGNAKSDMHHIFPSKININSDRASYEYNEIKDNITQKWYLKDKILNTIPATNINSYSEFAQNYFEPRENKKGDIARALFYIKTIYRDQTNQADPNFFDNQKDTLCKWHFYDPVDSIEWARTWKIAKYQDGKPNPFVLDCSLAYRTYCDFISAQCIKVNTEEIYDAGSVNAYIYPNPVFDEVNLKFFNTEFSEVNISVFDLMGRQLTSYELSTSGRYEEKITIPVQFLTNGIYLMKVIGKNENKYLKIYKLFIKQ